MEIREEKGVAMIIFPASFASKIIQVFLDHKERWAHPDSDINFSHMSDTTWYLAWRMPSGKNISDIVSDIFSPSKEAAQA